MPDEHPRTVLVVEDVESTRKILEYTFRAEGFVPLGVASVQEAMHTLKSVVPDLVVVDAGLPDAHGSELCKALRSEPSKRHIPIVMVSANPEDVVAEKAPPGSYDVFLGKPFSLKRLVQTVRMLITGEVDPTSLKPGSQP